MAVGIIEESRCGGCLTWAVSLVSSSRTALIDGARKEMHWMLVMTDLTCYILRRAKVAIDIGSD